MTGDGERGAFLKVEIDLGAEIPRSYELLGGDEDGPEYRDEPTTILDQVVAAAAQQLIGVKERDLRKAIVKEVEGQVASFVRSQMPSILKEALTGRMTIPALSEYQSDTVVPSLRDMIVKEAQQQLRKTSDRYGNSKPVLQALVEDGVKAALGGDLREEIEKARGLLRAEIARRAQEILGAGVELDLQSLSRGGSDF